MKNPALTVCKSVFHNNAAVHVSFHKNLDYVTIVADIDGDDLYLLLSCLKKFFVFVVFLMLIVFGSSSVVLRFCASFVCTREKF